MHCILKLHELCSITLQVATCAPWFLRVVHGMEHVPTKRYTAAVNDIVSSS